MKIKFLCTAASLVRGLAALTEKNHEHTGRNWPETGIGPVTRVYLSNRVPVNCFAKDSKDFVRNADEDYYSLVADNCPDHFNQDQIRGRGYRTVKRSNEELENNSNMISCPRSSRYIMYCFNSSGYSRFTTYSNEDTLPGVSFVNIRLQKLASPSSVNENATSCLLKNNNGHFGFALRLRGIADPSFITSF